MCYLIIKNLTILIGTVHCSSKSRRNFFPLSERIAFSTFLSGIRGKCVKGGLFFRATLKSQKSYPTFMKT